MLSRSQLRAPEPPWADDEEREGGAPQHALYPRSLTVSFTACNDPHNFPEIIRVFDVSHLM